MLPVFEKKEEVTYIFNGVSWNEQKDCVQDIINYIQDVDGDVRLGSSIVGEISIYESSLVQIYWFSNDGHKSVSLYGYDNFLHLYGNMIITNKPVKLDIVTEKTTYTFIGKKNNYLINIVTKIGDYLINKYAEYNMRFNNDLIVAIAWKDERLHVETQDVNYLFDDKDVYRHYKHGNFTAFTK